MSLGNNNLWEQKKPIGIVTIQNIIHINPKVAGTLTMLSIANLEKSSSPFGLTLMTFFSISLSRELPSIFNNNLSHGRHE